MNTTPVPLTRLVKHTLRPVLNIIAWSALNLAVVASLAFILAPRLGAHAEFSFVALGMTQVTVWFQFAMGISLVHEQLRAFISLGISRRRFAVAAGITLVISSALMAAIGLLAFQLEGTYYAMQGWEHTVIGESLFARTGNLSLLFIEGFTGGLVYAAAGLLVGWSYQSMRAPLATAMLLVTALLPLGLGTGLLSDPRLLAGLGLRGAADSLPVLLRPVLAVLFGVLEFLVARHLLSRLALRYRSS